MAVAMLQPKQKKQRSHRKHCRIGTFFFYSCIDVIIEEKNQGIISGIFSNYRGSLYEDTVQLFYHLG
ncbi:MAG: hypothetical protein VKK42_03865 [Lyngbya sp.]|nr:hypothetical protein [Lyngbya sp.]